jgi:hypothetical protein
MAVAWKNDDDAARSPYCSDQKHGRVGWQRHSDYSRRNLVGHTRPIPARRLQVRPATFPIYDGLRHFGLDYGLWVRRVRFGKVTPDLRRSARLQAEFHL